MSKEKVNSVPTTLPEKSESEVVQVTGEVVEVSSPYKTTKNSPKTSRSTWIKIQMDYESGSMLSCRELAERHGVHPATLETRMRREKWKDKRNELLRKVTEKVQSGVVKELSEADQYLKRSFLRSQKYEQMLEASVSQMATNEKGVPLVDPDALDTLSRSEARVHEWAKSCLRIIPVSQIDHTSNGESLGQSFVSAISKLRESKDTPRLQGEDLSKVLEAEVE